MKATYGRRVTDLFVEGTELVLQDGSDGEEPLLIWVQKLNPFEREDAMRSGQVARSRVMLALQQAESDELDLFRGTAAGLTDDQLREAIVDASFARVLSEATELVRNDPDWKERLEILDRSDEQLVDRPEDDPELQLATKLNTEYLDEIQRRGEELRDQTRDELKSLSTAKLRKRYEESWREGRGTGEFLSHYRLAELYYTARVCGAGRDGERWTHVACDHRQRVFDHRDEVKTAPTGLLEQLRTALDRLNMTTREAKNSPRQESSSASSPLPSEPEASTASTPDATQPELVGTSASPSPTP